MNWYYDEPEGDENTRRVVYSRQQILDEYRKHWLASMRLSGLDHIETMSEDQIDEEAVEDWVIVNWAAPTDMPPGVYIT